MVFWRPLKKKKLKPILRAWTWTSSSFSSFFLLLFLLSSSFFQQLLLPFTVEASLGRKIHTRRLNSIGGRRMVGLGGLAARWWLVQLHGYPWQKQATSFLAIFRPTSAASLANLNSFGILMRFLARWHQVFQVSSLKKLAYSPVQTEPQIFI